jgi:hypothetical protein
LGQKATTKGEKVTCHLLEKAEEDSCGEHILVIDGAVIVEEGYEKVDTALMISLGFGRIIASGTTKMLGSESHACTQ